jgi:pyruvate formate lyase activating enzyme
MRGVVFNTRSFSVHDGPGIRKAIFFKGCPLRCAWCHNPESHSFDIESVDVNQRISQKTFCTKQEIGKIVSVEELMVSIRADIPFFEESGGGVTLTGGEPLAQPSFALELLKACKLESVHTALDTCGYAPWGAFEQTLAYTDLYLFDLKLASPKLHKQYTGVDNEMILKNLQKLSNSGKTIIIRIPLVQGITDTKGNIEGLKEIISSAKSITRIDFLPYHSLAKHKFSKQGKEYSLGNMENYPKHKAQEIAHSFEGLTPLVSVGG